MDPIAEFKAGQRASWVHFAAVATRTVAPAAQLVSFAQVRPDQTVLDVACGTGVVAITAARQGARVTASDLTPELIAVARENGRLAAVEVQWSEADVEALPYPDASFDVVLSQFGHMFAPRPDVAIGEMLRVLKPGGTIAINTWPPELFVGRMFALTARFVPPPPAGIPSPIQWGDPTVVTARLGDRVKDLRFHRESMIAYILSPQHYRHETETAVGPVIRLVANLKDQPEKLTEYRGHLEQLAREYWDTRNNAIIQGYLQTRATKR